MIHDGEDTKTDEQTGTEVPAETEVPVEIETENGQDKGEAASPEQSSGQPQAQPPEGPTEGPNEQPAAQEAQVTAGEPAQKEAGTPGQEGLKQQIEALTGQVSAFKDKWLRAEADMDNFRKRVHRERLEQLKYGSETLIRELLPVIDNLERALEYAGKQAQKDSLHEGVDLTLKMLKKVVEGFGVVTISTVGQPFDPNFHEGIGMQEGPDYEDNVIIKEVEKGYMYKDRLLRPAKVIVGKKAVQEHVN